MYIDDYPLEKVCIQAPAAEGICPLHAIKTHLCKVSGKTWSLDQLEGWSNVIRMTPTYKLSIRPHWASSARNNQLWRNHARNNQLWRYWRIHCQLEINRGEAAKWTAQQLKSYRTLWVWRMLTSSLLVLSHSMWDEDLILDTDVCGHRLRAV